MEPMMKNNGLVVFGICFFALAPQAFATTPVCGQRMATRIEARTAMDQSDAYLSAILRGDSTEATLQNLKGLLCREKEQYGCGISYQYMLLRYAQAMVHMGDGKAAASLLVAECPYFSAGTINTAALDEMCRIVGRYGSPDDKEWMKNWYVLILREPESRTRCDQLMGIPISKEDLNFLEAAMPYHDRLFCLFAKAQDMHGDASRGILDEALRSAWRRPMKIERSTFYRTALTDVYGVFWRGYLIRNYYLLCFYSIGLLSLLLNCLIGARIFWPYARQKRAKG
jgi:hypothetical protein